MEIRQLRYVLALADTLHFGRAAEREYITQSALSQQISRLERELGTQLFERGPRGVRLTQLGELFVQRATLVLADLSDLQAEVREIATGRTGALRIGLFGAAGGQAAHEIVSAFHRLFPGVSLGFVELNMTGQVERVTDQTVDVAFLHPPMHDVRIEVHPLFSEPRYAAVPAQHPLGDASDLAVADLIDEPFVAPGPGAPADWRSFWCFDDDRGEPARTPAFVDTITESLAAVAHLDVLDTVPASFARHRPFSGVKYVAIRDASFATVALVHRAGDSRPLVTAFRELAVRLAHDQANHLASATAAKHADLTAE